MPIKGEIRRGVEIGKKSGSPFIWYACEVCGKFRWILYSTKIKQPFNHRCIRCGNIKTDESGNRLPRKIHQYRLGRLEYCRQYRAKHRLEWEVVRLTLKKDILTHYGNGQCKCIRCGFEDLRALTIDHVSGNGTKHRRSIRTGNFYSWLKYNNYPSGFQTLCGNCQLIKKDENRENRHW